MTSVVHPCEAAAPDVRLKKGPKGKSGLQNLKRGDYQFDWKTERSYARSCRTMRLDLGDGLPRTAEFRFT